MRPNPMRDKFAAGEVALGGWLGLPATASAEVMGGTGFDYVNVDMQHGMIDYAQMLPMLQAIAIGSSTPLVRVPWNEPGIIGKVLDAGAMLVEERDLVADWRTIRAELEAYEVPLTARHELVAINKMDVVQDRSALEAIEGELAAAGRQVFHISAATGAGMPELMAAALRALDAADADEAAE